MEEFVLPPNQTLAILCEGDTITVRRSGEHKKRKANEGTSDEVISKKKLKTEHNKEFKKPKHVEITKKDDKKPTKKKEQLEKSDKLTKRAKPATKRTKDKTINKAKPTEQDSESKSTTSGSEPTSSSESESAESSDASDSTSEITPPPKETKTKKPAPTKISETNHEVTSKLNNIKFGDAKTDNTKQDFNKKENKITKFDSPSEPTKPSTDNSSTKQAKHFFFADTEPTPTKTPPKTTTPSTFTPVSKDNKHTNKEKTNDNNYNSNNNVNENNYYDNNYDNNNDNSYDDSYENGYNNYNYNNSNSNKRNYNRNNRGPRDTGWDKALAEGDVLRNVSFILANDGTPTHSRAMQKFLKNNKPDRDYALLCPLSTSPKVSDKIAFKILELVDLSPIVSDFKEGTVEKYDIASQQIVIRLDPAFVPPPKPLPDTDTYGDEYDGYNGYNGYDDSTVYEEVPDLVETFFTELMEVKLISRDGKEIPKDFLISSAATSTPNPLPSPTPSSTSLRTSTSSPSTTPSPNNNNSNNNSKTPPKRRRAGLSGLLVTLQKEAQTKQPDTSGSHK